MIMKKKISDAVPVQVYLGRDAQRRLDRLAAHLDATKSEILRRGLLALERDLLDPASHPALRLSGLAAGESAASGEDAAGDHDGVLADGEDAPWRPPAARRR